jgi:hypothetical protein
VPPHADAGVAKHEVEWMRNSWFASMKLRRAIAVIVVCGFLPLATTGCFGNFSLTRKVYDYNKEVSPDKWVRWLVFLVLNVIPVYGFATIFDALFANSLEFWTGENPVAAAPGAERIVRGPHGEVARATLLAPGIADLDVVDRNGRTYALRLVREEGTIAAYERDGRFLMRVGDGGGAPAVLARAAE